MTAARSATARGARPGDAVPLLGFGVDPSPRWTPADWLTVACLTALALALRLPGLDHGLWIDEILTLLHYAPQPVSRIVSESDSLNNHVLYTLAAHYSLAWFGDSAWALRLPALLFGVATVPLLYHLGRQLTNRPEALLATVLLALNYHHVWFSQNARGYTGLLLGAVAATVLFVQVLATARPRWRLVAGYAVVMALASWLHLTAAMVLVAHGLVWASLLPGALAGHRLRSTLPAGIALLLAFTLALAVNALTLRGMLSKAMPAVFGTESGPMDAWLDADRAAESLSWGASEFHHGFTQALPGGWPLLGVVALVLIAGVVSYARQRPAVLGLLLIPALTGLSAIAVSGMLLFPRFLFSSAAFFILLGVRGGFTMAAAMLPFLRVRHVLLAGLAVAMVGATRIPAAWQPKQAFEPAAAFVAEQRAPGDAVVCLAGSAAIALQDHLGLACEPVKDLTGLEETERGHRRVWLLYTLPEFTAGRYPLLWDRIHAPGEYAVIGNFTGTVHGGDVTVLRKDH